MVETVVPGIASINAVRDGDLFGATMDILPVRGLKSITKLNKNAKSDAAGSITINDRRLHHNTEVRKRVSELEAEGYTVTTEVTFKSGNTKARVDIIATKDGKNFLAEEVKTGAASLSKGQKAVYPRLVDGSATPVGRKAEDAGLSSGRTLNQSGIGPLKYEEIRKDGL